MATDDTPVHTSLVRSFTQADFDAFARLSGDDNAIHVDAAYAAANTHFGRPVAHGMLLFTVLQGLLRQLAPEAQLANTKLMFPAPTYTDDEVEFTVSIDEEPSAPRHAYFKAHRLDDGVITCEGAAELREGQG